MDRPPQSSGPAGEVLEELGHLSGEPRTDVLTDFTRRLLSRASDEWLQSEPAERVAMASRALLDLIDRTPQGEVGVDVVAAEKSMHRAVLLTVMPDCPFIVETLREGLQAAEIPIIALLHPVLGIERDSDGRVARILDRGEEGEHVSATLTLLDTQLDADTGNTLRTEALSRLSQVQLATEDFHPMKAALETLISDLEEEKTWLDWRAGEVQEIQDLLSWLVNGNFVLLGYREYVVDSPESGARAVHVSPGTGLGLMRDDEQSGFKSAQSLSELPAGLRARLVGGPMLIVSKTNALSPVHRRARMDDISVKKIGRDGEVEGERRFLGLFTAKAFAQDASRIPILRRKLVEILEAEQVDKGSHDHGLVVRTFNSLPKEELFLTPVADLVRMIDTILETHGTDEVLLYAKPDSLRRGVNVMVILPRRKFSGEVRRNIQAALVESYDGQLLNYYLTMGEGEQARLHFSIAAAADNVESVDIAEVRTEVRAAIRSWTERLTVALEDRHDRGRTAELAERYGNAFPSAYRAVTDVSEAVDDIESLEALRQSHRRQVGLHDLDPYRPFTYRLKVFDQQTRYVLSDVLPVLENLGFRVLTADAYDIRPVDETDDVTVHSFLVQVPEEWEIELESAGNRVSDAFFAIQNGWAENLGINNLILSAGLTWRQVALIKAYGAYAFRIGAVSSRMGLRRPVLEHPQAVGMLFRIFEVLFDPGFAGDRDEAVTAQENEFGRLLEDVRSIEDDRTLRRLLALVKATVRTNYYQAGFSQRPETAIALKFDCSRIEFMPKPRPKHEVWVSSAQTEGAHLRMGDVARGGLRWSDRQEDFRLEVLGLVKTQQVKNAVIVPAGSKGAFVVNRPPADPEARREAGVSSYRDFVGALLSVTDNVVEGEIVHPPDTVIRDGDDPYLVVAADKGTATLSDTANELSAEYDFWLGDAFASGGSKGFDHKAMGITARGAWECVKRHFREMGADTQTEEFTVAGIGDMSGDVFGNGMLLSRTIRLVAAFDHRHIFLDPDPDAESSWEERRRLFDLPRSSWDDYDRSLISAGGGIWERGDKSIRLSPEIRAALGVDDEEMNGDTLIRTILRAPVDLLWNGGIGTYVKASSETPADVGDPGNDSVRIDATELRARVLGEGGNLGLTQPGRVEFALRGGRCNTDALDNSAGVDTSDHEVNCKILLAAAIESGVIDPADRDRLLQEATDDVASRVLRNSYWQSLAVSLDEHRVRDRPQTFRDSLAALERSGFLDRGLEFLPGTEEMLDREENGLPALVRPELSVLLAYAKLQLKDELLASDVGAGQGLLPLLQQYFPSGIREAVGEELLSEHRLARHIAVTLLTNLIVDLHGGTGMLQLLRDSQRDPADVAKAWYVAWQVGGAAEILGEILAPDSAVPAGVQSSWLLLASSAIDMATRWLLANADLRKSLDELLQWFEEPVSVLTDSLIDLLSDGKRAEMETRIAVFRTDGMTEGLAERFVALEYLDGLLPVAQLAREADIEASLVGRVYFGLAGEVDFPWLQDRLADLPGADRWQLRAARELALDLEAARRRIVRRLLEGIGPDGDPLAALVDFRESCTGGLGRVERILDELREEEGGPGLPGLVVAVNAIQQQCDAWSAGKE
ncbi:MAG: NAD-glutamate dehydrogenase [Gemmatimonadetes bacterium]|nr:NAD-glutamate dehydrogenase [Gemmatimonadota bacterium]